MADTVGVQLVDYAQDGSTGHVVVHLRGVETDDAGNQTFGPLKTFGIDAESLQTLYAGDYQQFILAKKDDVLKLLNVAKAGTVQLQALKGTLL